MPTNMDAARVLDAIEEITRVTAAVVAGIRQAVDDGDPSENTTVEDVFDGAYFALDGVAPHIFDTVDAILEHAISAEIVTNPIDSPAMAAKDRARRRYEHRQRRKEKAAQRAAEQAKKDNPFHLEADAVGMSSTMRDIVLKATEEALRKRNG